MVRKLRLPKIKKVKQKQLKKNRMSKLIKQIENRMGSPKPFITKSGKEGWKLQKPIVIKTPGGKKVKFIQPGFEAKKIKAIDNKIFKNYNYNPDNLGILKQRFAFMRELNKAGLGVVKPKNLKIAELPNKKKEIVFETEKAKGVPVENLKGPARKFAEQKVKEEERQIKQFIKKNFMEKNELADITINSMIGDLSVNNAIFDPKSKKVTFIDPKAHRRSVNKFEYE